MMKNLLFILLAATSIQSCEEIKLIEASSQKWFGGITGAPGGVNYEIALVAMKNSEELAVDQLWVNESFFKVQGAKKLPARSADGYKANDTIYVHATNVEVEVSDTKAQSPPRPSGINAELIIGYTINGKRKYLGVDEIKSLNSMANP